MPMYSASFAAVAVTAAQDLFEIVAHSTSRVAIWSIDIAQYSDAGDAAAEMLSISVLRGHATSGSGGGSVTPVNFEPWSRAAVTTVERNNTTVASTGSPLTLVSTAFNVQAGWFWQAPSRRSPIWLEASTRLVVRLSAPADELTMNGTIIFEETGLGLPPGNN